MSFQVKTHGLVELERTFYEDIPKQVRFAMSQAINDGAKLAQTHEIEKQLPSRLTLRSNGAPWWKPGTRYGVNLKPFATKDSLRAVLGSQADWLRLQEEGGTKKAGGHRLAIEAGARPSDRAVLPKSLKPRQLLKERGGSRRGTGGRGFIIQTKSGPAIFIREGATIKLMYMLEQSAKVPAVLAFFESSKAVYTENFQRLFTIRFKAAVATAR